MKLEKQNNAFISFQKSKTVFFRGYKKLVCSNSPLFLLKLRFYFNRIKRDAFYREIDKRSFFDTLVGLAEYYLKRYVNSNSQRRKIHFKRALDLYKNYLTEMTDG